MQEQKMRWRFSGDFMEESIASHMLCSLCPTYTPSEIQGRLLRKNGNREQDATAARLIHAAWSSVSKRSSWKEGQWARWFIFSRGGLNHRLWAECSSSWSAGLISPQATEGWISFSLKDRGQNGYLWSQKHWCFCMGHLLVGDGKGEVILVVLPH